MEEIICEIVFVNIEGQIRSRSKFDGNYFNNNKELASSLLEGLHFDFLHRMKEEGLIEYQRKLDA